MNAPVIESAGLGKRYYLGDDRSRFPLAHALMPWLNVSGEKEFWAIRDLSFEIQEGEAVGIIGQNGAGKSTLLKVLSRITAPTEGRARVRGRVGTLLEVGTGFHPELSGRENIYLNGSIIGMKPREIAARFDEIVDFSEIEKFIDTPLKRYSSGMYMRLAFAVAIHLDPDILIVDEILAVGDLAFQRKSLQRLREAKIQSGRTILFVSHSLSSMRNFCQRAIVLKNGRMTFDGPIDDGINHYMSGTVDDVAIANAGLKDRLARTTGAVRITTMTAFDINGLRSRAYRPGETVRYVFEYEVLDPVPNMIFQFQLYSNREYLGHRDHLVAEICEVVSNTPLPAGRVGLIELTLPDLKLLPNELALYVRLGRVDVGIWYDVVDGINVNLPNLVIRGTAEHKQQGLFSIEFDLKETAKDKAADALLPEK